MSTHLNSTVGKSILRETDNDVPWWALSILAVVAVAILAALITTIVLCWHYHAEHEAGDARAGNMEQCIETVHPYPHLRSEHQGTHPFSRSRRHSGRSNESARNVRGGGLDMAEPIFSSAARMSALTRAFHGTPG